MTSVFHGQSTVVESASQALRFKLRFSKKFTVLEGKQGLSLSKNLREFLALNRATSLLTNFATLLWIDGSRLGVD